jgi:hypothetical protein
MHGDPHKPNMLKLPLEKEEVRGQYFKRQSTNFKDEED